MKMDKKIIDRVLNNEGTPEEAQMVARWFATEDGQNGLAARFDEEAELLTASEENFEEVKYPAESMERWFTSYMKGTQRMRRLYLMKQAAIWMLLLALGGLLTWSLERMEIGDEPRYAEVSTSAGERMRVAFQDGSIVLLNAKSTLRYPVDFGRKERKVALCGEAYFEVKKGDKRPFLVDAGGLDVKVLGTQFNVKGYRDEALYVTLDEGSVMLNDHKLLNYKLKPGDHAIYNRETGNCQIMHLKDQHVVSAWRNNELYFYLTPLGDILKTLERQLDVKFKVTNSAVLKNRFTVSSDKQDIQDILKDLEAVSYIRFHPLNQNTYEVVSQ